MPVNAPAACCCALPARLHSEQLLQAHHTRTQTHNTCRGVGCVPIHNLMEDAATAEISRSQLWQWARHSAETREGRRVTADWALQLLGEETEKFRG